MDSLKEIKQHTSAAEDQISTLLKELQDKIGHVIVGGRIQLNPNKGKHQVELQVDVFDHVPKQSNIITPQIKTLK